MLKIQNIFRRTHSLNSYDLVNKRISYYLGNAQNVSSIPVPRVHHGVLKQKEAYSVNVEILEQQKSHMPEILVNKYIQPLLQLTQGDKTPFLYSWGDVARTFDQEHVIAKTRLRDDQSVVLLKLEAIRHWDVISKVKEQDIPYHRKKNAVVWRGVTTGSENRKASRFCLVNKYFNTHDPRIDVGFNRIVQNKDQYSLFVKPAMSMKEQLEFKFIISVEGNDVASGLKWQLNSNSVVMIARPTICSWAMEDHLEPYVHFLPLADDYSDLEQKLAWGLAHPFKCRLISRNARNFIKQFLDEETEQYIQAEVMRRYLSKVKVQ